MSIPQSPQTDNAAAAGPPPRPTVLAIARAYVAAGLSVIPIKLDTSKAPAVGAWKPYQERRPTDAELVDWFGRRRPLGIATVGGAVSGNLELFDFDKLADEVFAEWCDLIEAECPGLLGKLNVVQTPRLPVGYHARFRCPAVATPGNTVLAEDTTGEKPVRLIETRGEGGYALAPGSPPECHENKTPYEHISGPPLTELAEITPDERDVLERCARALSRGTAEPQPVAEPPPTGPQAGRLRPGDDFNARGPDIPELIRPHGWAAVRKAANGPATYWRRPGKGGPGWSATTGFCKSKDGHELFAVFSTDAYPFPGPSGGRNCSCHSKFDVYTRLNHGGDYSAAAKALYEQGYGDREPTAAFGPKPSANGRDGVTVGPFRLKPGRPRRTASGKVVVGAEVYRGNLLATVLTVTSTASSWEDPARVLSDLEPGLDRGAARKALAELVGLAARKLAGSKAAEGPTVREVVAGRVAEALRLTHRTDRGLWSEAQGQAVVRSEVIGFTPSWLLDAAAAAADAPRVEGGDVDRAGLIRAVQMELSVLWADQCASLPRAADADLGADTEAGRRFWEAMVRLWTKTMTFEVMHAAEGDRAARASLASRVRTAVDKLGSNGQRTKWEEVQKGFAAWWRVHPTGEEVKTLLALRWELVGQVGQELPGVYDQPTLTRLGERYGVLDPDPGVPRQLSGGKARLAVLSPNLTDELLENPAGWPADAYEESASDA
jgi:putative DNA primase/helicase